MEILCGNTTHTLFSESILQVLTNAELPGKQLQESFKALIMTQQLIWEDSWPDYSWSTILSQVFNTPLACCILRLSMPNYGGLILHSNESRQLLTYWRTATVLSDDKVDYPDNQFPRQESKLTLETFLMILLRFERRWCKLGDKF